MNKWQPIETAPMATWILVWAPSSIVRSAALCQIDGRKWWTEGRSGELGFWPTHWMPLPEPPTKAD